MKTLRLMVLSLSLVSTTLAFAQPAGDASSSKAPENCVGPAGFCVPYFGS